MTTDSNGKTITHDLQRAPDGIWWRTTWWGVHYVTTVRRYGYRSRRAARAGDISDAIGRRGRIA